MVKIGVIGVPGGWSSEALVSAVERKTGFRLLLEMDQLYYDAGRESLFFGDLDLLSLDALIVKKIGARYSPDHLQRLELLRHLQEKGLKIFSDPPAIMRCLDRLSCTLALRQAGIPMPETVVTEHLSEAERAVRRFRTAILKPLFTSKARGMQVLEEGDPELRQKIAAFQSQGNQILYVQQKIALPGRDLGIAFLGERYVGAYARIAPSGSWNTTTVNGGHYEAVEPIAEEIILAARAAARFGLDFTCVDVVESASGPMVLEVSALGGFRGLWEAQRLPMAEMIVAHVLEALSHGGR